MVIQPQTCAIGIPTNPLLRRQPVLNLGHFDFDIVSYFDIRISDFRPAISHTGYLTQFVNHTPPFMQNKPNFKIGKIALTPYHEKHYGDIPAPRPPKNKPNQSQSKIEYQVSSIEHRKSSIDIFVGQPANPVV